MRILQSAHFTIAIISIHPRNQKKTGYEIPLQETLHLRKSGSDTTRSDPSSDNDRHDHAQDRVHHPVPGDPDFDERDAPVQFVLNEWAQGTTIHGVANMSDPLSWKLWKRILWLLLICTSGLFMLWQIKTLISEYRDYDVVTDRETIVPTSLPFPEVTICNSNPLSQTSLTIYEIDEPTTPEELALVVSATTVDDFIFSTEFNGIEKNTTEVWQPRMTNFGLCWSFQTTDEIMQPGLDGGLEILAFLNQYDYEINATEIAGALVFVQEPGTPINTQLPYLTASPGKNVLARISMTEFVREKQAPWARCHSESPSYTQAQCRVECIQAAQREACQCRTWGDDHALENINEQQEQTNDGNGTENLLYCTMTHDSECLEDFLEMESHVLQNSPACAMCELPPCRQTLYKGTISELDLSVTVLEEMEEQLGLPQDFVLQNIVWMQLNYDEIQSHRLTESKAVTFAQLLGSVGGSMGLFLGISALSIVELCGDLLWLRLIPRLFGFRHLRGLGAVQSG